jgi:hypothetical protein
MLVDIRNDHQFIRPGLRKQRVDPCANGVRAADNGASQHLRHMRLFHWRPVALDVLDRRLAETAGASNEVGERHLLGGGEPARFGIRIGGDDVDAHHRIGLA